MDMQICMYLLKYINMNILAYLGLYIFFSMYIVIIVIFIVVL